MRLRAAAAAAVVAAITAVAALPAGAARPGALIDQMVVFSNGSAKLKSVRAAGVTVKVGGRGCAVPAGTPLAALVRSKVAELVLNDYGSCSKKPDDASGLYVRKIGPDAGTGNRGWVYKVGTKQGTAGAADPSGPFGHGTLRGRKRVVWFYCHLDTKGGCERTLGLEWKLAAPHALRVTVSGYDDAGKATPAAGATVFAGNATGVTSAAGVATIKVGSGTQPIYAQAPGTIRSFTEKVKVP